jgi:hypothetical protein
MSLMEMRRIAREMQKLAADLPLARAPVPGREAEQKFFRQVTREITWGLTLNK